VLGIAQPEFLIGRHCLKQRKDRTMKENTGCLLLALILIASVLQSSCGYVAAGVAGAAIQDEISDREDEEEERARSQ
jgi:hypothetical protein